jgi:hypothetical protein
MTVARRRLLALVVLAWLAFLAIDLFFHAGILAHWYERGGPGLLSLEEAFARIPLGYLSFLIEVTLLLWLAVRLQVRGMVRGMGLGIVIGLALGVDRLLGMTSITTLEPALLAWWAAAQIVEMATAGAIVGCGLERERIGRLTLAVLLLVILAVVATVVMQNT